MPKRELLVKGLAQYPQTLLHRDLNERNIGLRWSNDTLQPKPSSHDQTEDFLSTKNKMG
jgi:hypothetical protein